MAEYIERPEYEEYKEKVDQRLKRGEARIEEAEGNIKTLTELMMPLTICGMLCEIISRSVSVSFV